MLINFDWQPLPGAHQFRISRTATQEDLDYCAGRKGQLSAETTAFVNLLPDAAKKGAHPDLLGLVALMCFRPFTAREVTLNQPVSVQFAETVRKYMKLEIGPTSSAIAPRQVPLHPREAVAFSGGNDSVAALYLSDPSAIGFFLRRAYEGTPPKSMYKEAAALHSCQEVQRSGRDVFAIDCSIEHLRTPIGFPVDWSNSIPAVLHADVFDLGSVAFGMIMESAYFIGHPHYSDLKRRAIYSTWAPLFSAVGLPLSLPTAGLSEVVTAKIASQLVPEWAAQSCVRGQVDNPCMRCFKCFRKTILDAAVTAATVPDEHFEIALTSKEVAKRLMEVPIHHEDVLAYSMRSVSTSHPLGSALWDKMLVNRAHCAGLEYLNRFYPKAQELLPEHLREATLGRIRRVAADMDAAEIAFIESWDLKSVIEAPAYLDAQARLEGLLEKFKV